MGPNSRDAVLAALGHITDELLQQRHVLQQIESKLEARDEGLAEDFRQVNRRVLEVERAQVALRNHVHGRPQTPAE